MSQQERIRQAVTLLQNLVAEALAAATVAALFHRGSLSHSKYTIDDAIGEVGKNGNAVREDIVRAQGTKYDLHLSWMVVAFVTAQRLVGAISVEKVAELRKQHRSTNTIFESILLQVLSQLERSPSGVLPCYRTIVGSPEQYSVAVLSLMGKVNRCAHSLKTFIAVLRNPILRWFICDLKPRHFVIASIIAFLGVYILTTVATTGSTEIETLRERIATDAGHVGEVWRAESGPFEKVGATLALVSQAVTVTPIVLMICAGPFYLLRRFVIKSDRVRSTLVDIEKQLIDTAAYLRVKPPSFIHVEEIQVRKTTNIGTIGPGAIVNLAEVMQNMTNTVNQSIGSVAQSSEVKSLVKELASQVKTAASVDPEKAKQMAGDLETLAKEMANASPRRKWYELSLDGLREAAEAVGKAGKPILEILEKLRPLILG